MDHEISLQYSRMVNWMIKSAAGVALGATVLCNVSPWFIPKAQQLSLAYIKQAQLQTLNTDKRIFNVSSTICLLIIP